MRIKQTQMMLLNLHSVLMRLTRMAIKQAALSVLLFLMTVHRSLAKPSRLMRAVLMVITQLAIRTLLRMITAKMVRVQLIRPVSLLQSSRWAVQM